MKKIALKLLIKWTSNVFIKEKSRKFVRLLALFTLIGNLDSSPPRFIAGLRHHATMALLVVRDTLDLSDTSTGSVLPHSVGMAVMILRRLNIS